jgi:hypothetical protein
MTYYRKWILGLRVLCLCFGIGLSAVTQALSPADAAEAARTRTGGKVLQVKAGDNGEYRVKVLMPSGQVRYLNIGANDADTPLKRSSK